MSFIDLLVKKRPSKPTSSTRNVQEGEQAKKKPISTAKKRVLTTKPPEKRRTFSEDSNNKSTSSEKEKEKKTTWLKFPSGRLKKTNQNHVEKSPNSVTTPKTRPVSTHSESRVILIKKGQQQTSKIDGQIDELSRASSESNLHVDGKNNKGAKPRKNDINNKIVEKKIDKKSVTKNNNKLDSNNTAYSLDSIHLQDIEQLKRRLTEMANENSSLISELEEKNTEINTLHKEIEKLKILKEDTYVQLEQLEQDNTTLRNRLRDVAHSPLSDNEKQQLLLESHRQHSSAPASIATNLADDGNGGDYTTCATPDSSSNVSEVSVACLQDKINQMQETHYSTNEELQATLQELTDLQKQLTELQQENDRLNEEKTLMFDSLCRQTERLNDSRSEVESLKQLLYREKNDADQFESAVEREQKLVDLLKSAQEERETFLVKIEQLSIELQDATQAILQKDETIVQLEDRVKTLECTLDAKHAEHKQLDQELAIAKDHCSGKQIEIDRLSDLLENARTKIGELEEDRKLSDKSELDELLDNARKEKDSLESEVAYLKEQWARSKNETEKLREQVSGLQEECKVTRNNAKSTQSDLEYKCEKLAKEKLALTEQLQQFQEAVNELQVQSQCQSEDKRQLSAVLSETQRNLSEAERKSLQLENELEELKRLRSEENEEWEKFQNDLLTSVRVANDFKTEAQQDLQKMILENKAHREKVRQLQAQIDKLTNQSQVDSLPTNSDMNLSKLKFNRSSASLNKLDDKQCSPKSSFQLIRRKEKPKKRTEKSLSVEEEMLLKRVDEMYLKIDPSVPDESLSPQELMVKKLKDSYANEQLSMKPVAPKPKDQLAISKPLLDSVCSNPKLEQVVNDPKMLIVESVSVVSELDGGPRGPIRSKSCDDFLLYEKAAENTNRLYRSEETEDLTQIHRKTNNLTYDTLNDILKDIDESTPYFLLSNEERFALKFKKAMQYAERKNTLIKLPKTKGVKISDPVPESVRRNIFLESILDNPDLPVIEKKNKEKKYKKFWMNLQKNEKVAVSVEPERSKSLDDLNWVFRGTYNNQKSESNSSEKSSESYTSAEFNVQTNEVGPYDRQIAVNLQNEPSETENVTSKGDTNVSYEEKALISENKTLETENCPKQVNETDMGDNEKDLIKENSSKLEIDSLESQEHVEIINNNFEVEKSHQDIQHVTDETFENNAEDVIDGETVISNINEDIKLEEKENKYGIICSLRMRPKYRSVVKEFKEKYATNEQEENSEQDSDIDDDDNTFNTDEFMDDFFGIKKSQHHPPPIQIPSPEDNILSYNVENSSITISLPDEEIDSKNVADDLTNEEKILSSIKSNIDEKMNSLTTEEVEILTRAKRDRFSRPLSNLNMEDLEQINRLSSKYLNEASTEEQTPKTNDDDVTLRKDETDYFKFRPGSWPKYKSLVHPVNKSATLEFKKRSLDEDLPYKPVFSTLPSMRRYSDDHVGESVNIDRLSFKTIKNSSEMNQTISENEPNLEAPIENDAIKKTQKFIGTVLNDDESTSSVDASQLSIPSIKVVKKREELDITQNQSGNIEDVQSSSVILFNPDSNVDKSNVNLLKINEVDEKQRYFNEAYNSDSDDSKMEIAINDDDDNNCTTKARVVDFVPLDDNKTQSVYENEKHYIPQNIRSREELKPEEKSASRNSYTKAKSKFLELEKKAKEETNVRRSSEIVQHVVSNDTVENLDQQ